VRTGGRQRGAEAAPSAGREPRRDSCLLLALDGLGLWWLACLIRIWLGGRWARVGGRERKGKGGEALEVDHSIGKEMGGSIYSTCSPPLALKSQLVSSRVMCGLVVMFLTFYSSLCTNTMCYACVPNSTFRSYECVFYYQV
jgi:hypothetical protein